MTIKIIHSVKQNASLHGRFIPSEVELELMTARYFEYRAKLNTSNHINPNQNTDLRNAMWYYLRAALRGDKEAEYKIGIGYLNGELSLDRSYTHAEKWLNQAIEHGHPKAKKALEQALNQISNS